MLRIRRFLQKRAPAPRPRVQVWAQLRPNWLTPVFQAMPTDTANSRLQRTAGRKTWGCDAAPLTASAPSRSRCKHLFLQEAGARFVHVKSVPRQDLLEEHHVGQRHQDHHRELADHLRDPLVHLAARVSVRRWHAQPEGGQRPDGPMRHDCLEGHLVLSDSQGP
eukprot:UN4964